MSVATTLATDSDTERPIRFSTSSKSQTVLPFSIEPSRVTAPVDNAIESTRRVFPAPPGPTSTTLRTWSVSFFPPSRVLWVIDRHPGPVGRRDRRRRAQRDGRRRPGCVGVHEFSCFDHLWPCPDHDPAPRQCRPSLGSLP